MKSGLGVVLNTRPRNQAAELSRLLRLAGFEVVEAPAIEVVPAWDPVQLQVVRVGLADRVYDWVVLASQNAGWLLRDELRRGRARVVCGAASARALLLPAEFTLDRFSASAVLELLRALVQPGQHILVPTAEEGDTELIDGLQALGARVLAPVAYRTLAVAPATLASAAARLVSGEVDVVTACSPSAITSLVAAVGPESISASELICIGETTAEAARRAALRVDAVADMTTMAALVEAVVAATASCRVALEPV
ncbi:MAG: uroporphyrinogen-III synthase [Chloroflexota bacterium]